MGVSEPPPPPAPLATWGDWAMPLVVVAMVLARARPARVVWIGLAYVGWAALSAAVHGGGWLKLLGLVELWLAMAAASALDERGRDRVLVGWIAGAAVLG